MEKVNLEQKLAQFHDYWSPKIVGDLNGQQVKLVKFQGDFFRARIDTQHRERHGRAHCPRAESSLRPGGYSQCDTGYSWIARAFSPSGLMNSFSERQPMRSKVWLLGLTLLFGAAAAAQDEAKTDLEPIQGGWKMVLVFINGEGLPARSGKTGEVIIEGDQYRASSALTPRLPRSKSTHPSPPRRST